MPSVEKGLLIVDASEPPAEKVNEVLAPKMDPLACGAAGWGAAGACEPPKLKMGPAAGGLANRPAGFVSVPAVAAPKRGFDSVVVAPKRGFESAVAAPKRGFESAALVPKSGFDSCAGVGAAAPNRLLVCVAGAAAALPKRLLVSATGAGVLVAPKRLLVSVAGAAGVLVAPKRLFVSGSAAGVDAAEPNKEPPDLLSPPKANFFAAGSSVLGAAGAGAVPNRLFVLFIAPAENREAAGFSVWVSVVRALPKRPPN